MKVAMYLRKSRADEEAEKRGDGETLAKHRTALLKHAKANGLIIVDILPEVASGESLIHRPKMLELLQRVETKEFDAVLVMDIDRLGRGNMQEQGLILSTFQDSNTKIITPSRSYDLANESDEFMTEVQSLFARRELRVITGRMQRGRQASVEEGNYIGTRPPYGYLIHKPDNGGRFLVSNPEQAPVVRMIFDWYVYGELGSKKIANELNKLGYLSYDGISWKGSAVLTIIKNEVYIGRIQWKKKESKKSKEAGKRREVKTREKTEWIDVKGKHEPLITEELFNKAQEILKEKYHVPYQIVNGMTNPLAGLIKCELCGASMLLRPYTNQLPHLMCTSLCSNKSARFAYVEEKLIQALHSYLAGYKLQYNSRRKKEDTKKIDLLKTALKNLQKELTELEAQKLSLHDYLERKVYDEETYLERSKNLADRINENKRKIAFTEQEIVNDAKKEKVEKNTIPKLENVLKLYPRAKTAADKNKLLKSVLYHATYFKDRNQKNDEFTLVLYPKASQPFTDRGMV